MVLSQIQQSVIPIWYYKQKKFMQNILNSNNMKNKFLNY